MKCLLRLAIASLCLVSENASSAEPGAPAAAPANPCAAPSRLSCELLLRPNETVIYDPRPEFAWECGSRSTGFLQSAYRLVVRRLADAGAELEVVWDSGRVESGESINVEYAGAALAPEGQYEWQVQAWNAAGVGSDWSEAQKFRMARRVNEARTSLYSLVQIPQHATSVRELPSGGQHVDFGEAAFGYLKLQLPKANAPRTLEVRFGEKMSGDRIDRNPGGTIRYYAVTVEAPAEAAEIVVRPPRNRRNTSGSAIRLPRSIGVIAPFRYVEIDAGPARLRPGDVTRVKVQYPFDNAAASFTSSDETLNAVWKLCKYSIEATTFCGVYVDGDRERIPYEADAYINQLAHYGVDREYALARHSHEYLLAHPTWPTEWRQHSILMAWADYWYTGNKESLAEHYDELRRDKMLSEAETASGLVDTSQGYRDIVDWPEAERDGYQLRPINTVVNAFHYATLEHMARIAAVVGRTDDSELFARKAQALHKEFNAALWSAKNGAYVDGVGSKHSSIHANLFPLAFGLVPPERIESVAAFVKSRKMACSVYAAQYLLEGLYENGEADYALELMTSQDKRSWYNMIRSGSTIALEAWDQAFKPNLDWNHAWGAAPANAIPFYLVGVRPLEAGFRKVVIQPQPGELQSFAARVPSLRGPIDVRYERSENSCRLDVSTPGNCMARIGVPLATGRDVATVAINGKDVPLNLDGAHAWIEDVPPGDFTIIATYADANTANNLSDAAP